MEFLFSGIFWGGMLILLGVSVIINLTFHIHVPLVRIVFALIIIYLGVRVLMGGHWCKSPTNTVLFCESKVSMNDKNNEYNILFGKGVIDTTTTAMNNVKINTIFGESRIKISKSVPTEVRVETAFAGVSLPDGNTISFGNVSYRNEACKNAGDSIPIKHVNVNTVFGGTTIVEQ